MITLCIPTYNRSKFAIRSFLNVIEDQRISEIVVCDDNSNQECYEKLMEEIKKIDSKKIKIFRNSSNLGAFLNKYECVKKASNEWIILIDSDNIIDIGYLEKLPASPKKSSLYLPDHAICKSQYLNYKEFSDKTIDIEEYKIMIKSQDPRIQCLLNTGNYFFNRDSYIKSVESEINLLEPFGCDVSYLIYLWFKSKKSNNLKVVRDLEYIHTLHENSDEESSHYIKTQRESSEFLKTIISLSENLQK
jgi:glycosyltransferase involved in cell wall biosynthesis